ncbi:MAG: EamA family transporter [Gemmatimonadaceae bacterium]|jgi:drug/metabolite transporter (DMT)-like permease|nr:EamA family transporter [Gemmatimonadaceae bacterium]
MTAPASVAPPPRTLLIAAFATIYVVWGSTYLAIRWVVEGAPPFLMASIRFAIAGALLYGWSRWRTGERPTREHWRNAAIIGAMLLGVGNGAVSWAVQHVPSGIASLVISATPLWLVILQRVGPMQRQPSMAELAGVGIGLAGVALLVLPTGGRGTGPHLIDSLGAVVLLVGCLSWAAGSLFARSAVLPRTPTMGPAMQMLTASVLLFVVAAVHGDLAGFDITRVRAVAWWSLLYLVVAGSLLGFTAFSWLMRVASPTLVGTYAYVNPVVAVILGVLLGGEVLPARAVLATVVIVSGVALVSLAPWLALRKRSAV